MFSWLVWIWILNFEFEGNFQVQAPGGLYLEGDLTNGFLGYEFWGLIFEGAYTYISEFYGIFKVTQTSQENIQP